MEIEIFKEITTEGVVTSIEENSAKYHVGFYADMNDPKQRKLVKDSAVDINNIIKQVDRARIDISKAAKVATDKEAKSIIDRLVKANKPFTDLLDVYEVERKKVLAAEKANKEAIALSIKIESDHEFALMMNDKYDRDVIDCIAAEKDELIKRELELAANAEALALSLSKQAIDDKLKAEKELKESRFQAEQDRLDNEWVAFITEAYDRNNELNAKAAQLAYEKEAEKNRLASIEYERLAGIERQRIEQERIDEAEADRKADEDNVRTINRAIFSSLIEAGVTRECATIATQALIDNKIPHTKINY